MGGSHIRLHSFSLHVLCSGVVLLVVHCIQGVTRVYANTERGEGTCNSNTHVLYTCILRLCLPVGLEELKMYGTR